MRKITILILLLSLTLHSCKDSEKESQLKQKEIELSKKEKQIKSESKKFEIHKKLADLDSEIENNIILCQNAKFIIKIDNLKNRSIRYISWNRPKTMEEEPDLILYDGHVENNGTGGGYTYTFKNGVWNYIIENSLMGETETSVGLFLKIEKDGVIKLNTKMNNVKKEIDYDLKTYSINDLIGNWWTPHYAVRKIHFYNDNTFLFEEGDGKKFKGKFQLDQKTIFLNFNNGLDKILKLGGGLNESSLNITGDGENFVKE